MMQYKMCCMLCIFIMHASPTNQNTIVISYFNNLYKIYIMRENLYFVT